MTEHRALSLTRPWPYTILHLGKRIENRSRKDGVKPAICSYRGELYLHAAKSWDAGVAKLLWADGLLGEDGGLRDRLAKRSCHPTGIVGKCRAVAHLAPDGCCYLDPEGNEKDNTMPLDMRWWFGGYALVLSDVVTFEKPVPCKGALGVWRIPTLVWAQVFTEEHGLEPEDLLRNPEDYLP